jgi:hypothetical protein
MGDPVVGPHLARSVIGNYLDNREDIPAAASSLMLGHALPPTVEASSPTTQKFFLTGQRMDAKAIAMRAWSDALVEEFLKLKGTLPGN